MKTAATKQDKQRRAACAPIFDRDIRRALIQWLRAKDSTAVILEELPLARGKRRADVVSVNGILAGFEIKSEQDSLVRLVAQAEEYANVFDEMTVVIAPRHLHRVRQHVPQRWGICIATMEGRELVINPDRSPRPNGRTDRRILVRLLWKRECLRLLSRLGIPGRDSEPVRDLWRRLEKLPKRTLSAAVCEALKQRTPSTDQRQTQYGDSRTTGATE